MVGSMNKGFPLGHFIGIGASSEREFPGSGIMMHLIKERVRQGQDFAFVSYESEIDWTKYDHIFDPK